MSSSKATAQAQSDDLDDALDDTFPASDPPSMTDPAHGVGSAAAAVSEDAIRQRAYELWDEAGRPDGRQDDHWAQARRELLGDA